MAATRSRMFGPDTIVCNLDVDDLGTVDDADCRDSPGAGKTPLTDRLAKEWDDPSKDRGISSPSNFRSASASPKNSPHSCAFSSYDIANGSLSGTMYSKNACGSSCPVSRRLSVPSGQGWAGREVATGQRPLAGIANTASWANVPAATELEKETG